MCRKSCLLILPKIGGVIWTQFLLLKAVLKVQIPGELLGKVIKVLISNKRQPNKNHYVINLVYISGEMVYQWYEIWGSWPQQFKY